MEHIAKPKLRTVKVYDIINSGPHHRYAVNGKVVHNSSRGLQLQNFRRDVKDNAEELIKDVLEGFEIEHPADTLGSLTRAAITSKEGLTYSDYSQIEARVLPWLAQDPSAEHLLDVFREGRDIYIESAVGMFGLNTAGDVTKELRQASKQANLACGFGGSGGAVQAMARGYGMVFTDDEAKDLAYRWRESNTWAGKFWSKIKDAARGAFLEPEAIYSAGRIKFMYDGANWLWMLLPSGRCLAYFKPKLEEVEMPWGDISVELTCLWGGGQPKAGEKWPRRTLNHLILSENATQATAADIMREAIVRADHAGLPILFSVHDELVVEGSHEQQLHNIMIAPPSWADGLPIAAETTVSQRYGK